MEVRQISEEFTTQCILRLEENTPRVAKSLNQLTEEQVWQRPNAASNSIGNLVLHLCGNINQWIASSIGQQPDERQRDLEFETQGGIPKAKLLERLGNTVAEAIHIIESLTPENLMETRQVQGFEFTCMGNIVHVVEHYSYHTGQIAFYTKLLTSKDLDFYSEQDLNVKNQAPS